MRYLSRSGASFDLFITGPGTALTFVRSCTYLNWYDLDFAMPGLNFHYHYHSEASVEGRLITAWIWQLAL